MSQIFLIFSARKWERRAGSKDGEIFASNLAGDHQGLSLVSICGKAGKGVSKSFFGRRINDRKDIGDEGAVLSPQLLSFLSPQEKCTKLGIDLLTCSISSCRHFEGSVENL